MKKARHKWVTEHLRGTLSEESFLEDWASIERELAAKEAEVMDKAAPHVRPLDVKTSDMDESGDTSEDFASQNSRRFFSFSLEVRDLVSQRLALGDWRGHCVPDIE